MQINRENKCVRYLVFLMTGKLTNAGTDARVFIDILGDKGQALQIPLMRRDKDVCEEGQTDIFELYLLELGKIRSIRIWHDNRGPDPAWLLKEVRIIDPHRRSYRFAVHQWLSLSYPPHSLSASTACK